MNAAEPFVPAGDCLIESLPAAVYHSVEALSASGSKEINRSPAHFKVARTVKREPTPPMLIGSAAHTAILEPESFETEVVCAHRIDKRTRAGKEAAEEFDRLHAGKIVLDLESYESVLRMRDAVMEHPAARRLLEGTRRELSLFWRDRAYGVPCKSRFDAWSDAQKFIVDLKTTVDASPDAFGRAIGSYQYHLQAAFYYMAAEALLNCTPTAFVFIAVEKEPPYAVGCYVLETAHLLAGARLVEQALDKYKKAIEADRWAGYGDLIQPARVPSWALRFDN